MKRRRGFVLVMTLFVLALVVLALAGFARHSIKYAVDVSQAERDLQVKWGRASCQRVALDHCQRLLQMDEPRESASFGTKPKSELVVRLAGMDYWITLSDESAKANPNSFLALANESATLDLLKRLCENPSVVELDPQPFLQSSAPSNERLPTWDTVFRDPSGSRLAPAEILPMAKQISLWSGGLNYRAASEETLFECVRAVVGGIVANRVIRGRHDAPQSTVNEMLTAIEANDRQRTLLIKLLSDQSDAYGIWVRTYDGRKNRYDFAVKRYYSPTLFRIYTLAW